MKLIYVGLIALGTGIIGFVAGGGLGLLGGATAGSLTGGIVGSVAGMCLTVDTATEQGVLTPTQAEAIGLAIGKQLSQEDGIGALPTNIPVEGATESCGRLVQGIVQNVNAPPSP